MLKTISPLQRGTVQRMSDELLKWLFGVNEVLKMSIATDHSDVPAQAFQLHLLKCTRWFRRLLFHAYFSGNIEKTVENGRITFSCFMNLNILLFAAKRFTSNCHSSCNFFFSLPTSTSEFSLVISYSLISLCDSSLSSLPLFQKAVSTGGTGNRNLMLFDSGAAPVCYTPVAPAEEAGRGSCKRRGGGLSNAHHT